MGDQATRDVGDYLRADVRRDALTCESVTHSTCRHDPGPRRPPANRPCQRRPCHISASHDRPIVPRVFPPGCQHHGLPAPGAVRTPLSSLAALFDACSPRTSSLRRCAKRAARCCCLRDFRRQASAFLASPVGRAGGTWATFAAAKSDY